MPTFYGPPSDGTVIPQQLEDALVADVGAPGSALRDALDAAGLGRDRAAIARQPGLAQVAKSTVDPFRIMLSGTSIANNTNSGHKTIAEHIVTRYGDSGAVMLQAGGIGGSYTNTYSGWSRQPYGGPLLIRLRGTAGTAQPFTLNGYGDRVVVEWSRESDTAPIDVTVDGAVVATIGTAGAQAYSQRTEITVPRGPHRVTINPPATGNAYIEALEVLDTDRAGVEIRDTTLGGSSIKNMVDVRAAQTGQVEGIAIVGDNGLKAFYDRADVDLHLVSYTVNDAGAGAAWATGGYIASVDKIVEITRRRNVPVVFVIEMGGHYSLTTSSNHAAFNAIREHLLSLSGEGHVTVVDWHGATILADKQEYMRRYYSATNLDEAAGTFSGDFIHPNKSAYRVLEAQLAAVLPTTQPARELPSQIAADRLRAIPAGGWDKQATVDGATKRYAAPAGATYKAVSAGYSSYFQGRTVHYYRDGAATNIAATTQANIDASTTSDGFGKYVDLSTAGIGLGSTPDWVGGERVILTMRVSGTAMIRADGDIGVYGNGVLIPKTDTVNGRTVLNYVVGSGAEPLVLSYEIGSASASKTLYVSGRVYEIAIVRSTVPVLI